MWRNDGSTGTTVSPYTFIPRNVTWMTPIIGWGVTTGSTGATGDSQQIITYVESPCTSCVTGPVDICTTLHYVLINTGATGSFSINWEQQLLAINNGDQFGPNIPGSITTMQSNLLSEPTTANNYRHYCVKFTCQEVNLVDCPTLLLGWRRVPSSSNDYSGSAYIVAATICCKPHTTKNCVGSIGFWKTTKGINLQCYPIYLGNPGGTYTIIVQSAAEADVILSKKYYTPPANNGPLNNLIAQLLAAKFAIKCNGAYVPSIVASAIIVADNYLTTYNPSTQYIEPTVEYPVNSGIFYSVSDVLQMYNDPQGLPSITPIGGGTPFVRADQNPAWPPENC